ncbi:hypothetical protein AHF37_06619, partial [Paragonimus kellicotti]
ANIIKVPKKSALQPTQAGTKKESNVISKEGEQALQEIREFELRLRASSDAADWCRKPKTTTDLIGQLRLLRTYPPTREQQTNSLKIHLPPEESEAYMARIKERVLEENRAMVEQEKRRRRIIVASLEEHHAYEEQRRARQLAERLLRQSQLERRLLVQLEQTKHEKSVLLANRIERQKEYESRRELEFQAAMDYEREIAVQRKQEEAATLAILREVWANQQARKRQASYTRHYQFVANEVVGLLLQFALQVADYRMLTGRLIPVKLFRQWKAQWIAGVPFWSEEPVIQDSECIQQTVVDEKKGNEQLNECDFMDYQEQRRARQLAERLLRQSQLERRLLVQLEQTKHEKSVLLANRIERQKEYESRRELEFQAAMDYERVSYFDIGIAESVQSRFELVAITFRYGFLAPYNQFSLPTI